MEVAAAKQLLPMARGPNSPSSSTSSSSPSSAASPSPRQQQPVAAPSPKPVPRIIDTTPFPTTFVLADTANFKNGPLRPLLRSASARLDPLPLMISAPLRVPAPKAAAVGTPPFSSASAPKPKPSRIRCAAAAAAPPASAAASSTTLYEVLGLRAGATVREIKAAYRRLAREQHPDVAGAAPGATAEFVRLHDAYATLSDPDSRARYDRGAVLAVAVAQRSPYTRWVASAGAGWPRRTWETDQCW